MIDRGTITRDEKLDSRSRKTPRRSRKKACNSSAWREEEGGGGESERELEEQKRERQKSYRGKLVDIPRLYRPAE